jgi:hypothetical protein
MQLAGTGSWRISTDEPQLLVMALYVRDAAGLLPQIDPDIPPLEPAVPDDDKSAPVNPVASVQWASWWQRLLEGGGFWPEHKSPSDLHRLARDPEIQRLFYWPSQHLPPDFEGLSGMPALRDLVRTQYEAARLWSEARHLEFIALSSTRQSVLLESEIVRTVERGLGRAARPFALDVRVLPVASARAWRTSSGRALVTRGLFSDRPAYRKWLEPIIEELA